MMNLYCNKCGKQMQIKDFTNRFEDVDHKKVGLYCRNCCGKEMEKLKQSRFIEEYKGNKIYCKDGKYIPYWGCHYYFMSLEDCKNRIDNKNIAVVPKEGFAFINSMLVK